MTAAPQSGSEPLPRVFVSYAHDSRVHKRQVLRFCGLLRGLGVDVRVDEWDSDLRRDWYLWMIDQFRGADNVIVIASPQYRTAGDGDALPDCHRGVQTESAMLRDFLHGDRATWTRKILPVILPGRSAREIPLYLQPASASHYHVREITPAGVAELLGVITGTPRPPSAPSGDRLDVLRSAAPEVVSTLPRDVVSFTGRDAEVTGLVTRIDRAIEQGDAAIHVVDGMPGVGKTAFAVHVAHRVAGKFPDGHLFLELRGHTPGQQPVTPVDALGSLLLAVGVAARHVPAALDDRARLWRDRLAGRKMLLLLDDVADHEQVRALLPGTAGCQVVLTSRHRLAGLEDARPLPLGVLPAAQAVEMFLRLAGRSPDGDESELVRLCGHLPLAIGLAAGRLRSHPTWDVRYLTEQLVSTRDRLAEIRADDRSVVTAFAASYRDLPADVQRLFRRLSLHPGIDFDLDAAAAMGRGGVDATRARLETLYLNNLVEEPAPGRFRLHDLIRHFAGTLIAADPDEDPDAVVERVLDYYVHVATTAAELLPQHDRVLEPRCGTPPAHAPRLATTADAVRWFAAERINLSSCVEYSRGHGRARHTVHLAAVLHSYLAQQGHWDDALAIHDVACRVAERTGDLRGLAVSLRNRGVVRHLLEDYPAALTDLVRAHQLYAQRGDLMGAADVIQCIGTVQYATGDYAAATANLSAALALCEEVGDRFGVANARYRLGIVRHLTDDYRAAASELARAYTVFTEVGSRQGQADALSYLGLVQAMAGDHPPALRGLTGAAAMFERLGDRLGIANALCRTGFLLRVVGRYRESVAVAQRAHTLFADLGSCQGRANVLTTLAMARYLGGDRTEEDNAAAVDTLEEARALCGKVGDRLSEAVIHNALGVLHLMAGRCHEATETLGRALELCADSRDRTGKAETLNNLGRLAWHWPEAGDAFSHHKRALELAREIGNQLEEARALEGMGRCLVRDCHVGNGHAHLREALGLYERLGVPEAGSVRAALAVLA
ncbi:tetratricopeptide repeat protein [Actinophytocola glycyrrhizae]|uniref:Tetratricopeptide repeat protein n=1 Tax=Actinophytocola glycyrrhizae TaxID=2044873 RepID=A0ABV9S5I9_9PSEU